MKKLLSLLLVLCMLLSLASCASGSLETEESLTGADTVPATEQKTTEEEKTEIVPKIVKPLTWTDINAIPIANASMSTDELRQICVDFMALQLSFSWQSNKAFTFEWTDSLNTTQNNITNIELNTAYGGMPYRSSAWSNIYQIMYYYDEETGVLDTEGMGDKCTSIISNMCTSSTLWGWSRVCNTNTWDGISLLMEKNGAIRLGNYKVEETTDYYLTKTNTIEECTKNGEQTMYACYALIEKADGINYYHKTGGHVEMATQNAVVKRNPDGTINGEESYCYFQDQQHLRKDAVQSDGSPLSIMKGVEHKYTFKELYKEGYLPFTLAEFHGLDPVEKGTVHFTLGDKTSLSVKDFLTGEIRANYAISDVNISFIDKDGKVTGTKPYLMATHKGIRNTSLKCAAFGPQALLTRYITGEGTTMKVDVRISTGEVFTVYQGGITK